MKYEIKKSARPDSCWIEFKTKQTNYSINSDAYLKSNATFVLDFIYHK